MDLLWCLGIETHTNDHLPQNPLAFGVRSARIPDGQVLISDPARNPTESDGP